MRFEQTAPLHARHLSRRIRPLGCSELVPAETFAEPTIRRDKSVTNSSSCVTLPTTITLVISSYSYSVFASGMALPEKEEMWYPQRFGVLVGLFALATANVSVAEPASENIPTFSKHVAPILFDNCVVCHRPGEVAPMSFLSYKDVRPWSRALKEKVLTREMPPWHADPRYGDFRNDPALSQAQIDTIVAWAG